MNTELMKAILAMDSYNRGYNAGLSDAGPDDQDGLGEFGKKIGNATVLNFSLPSNAQSIGFYALAYSYNGETVISYRGTDDPFGAVSGSDISNGWALGAGNYNATQAEMAIQFYKNVAAGLGSGDDLRNAEISLAGHSLGGGLAGFVPSIH